MGRLKRRAGPQAGVNGGRILGFLALRVAPGLAGLLGVGTLHSYSGRRSAQGGAGGCCAPC